MSLKVAKLYWDLLLINLIDIHFLLEQEIRKSFFFCLLASYSADLFTVWKNRGRREILLKVLTIKGNNIKDLLIGCVFIITNVLRFYCLRIEALQEKLRAAIQGINNLNILSLITATNVLLTWSRKYSFYHSTALNSGRNCL